MLTVENNTKFDWANIEMMPCLRGNAMDTYYTVKVYAKLIEEIQEKSLENLYLNLISPLSVVFRDIEFEGMLIDTDKLVEIKAELEEKIREVKVFLMDSPRIPKDANLASNQQLCQILFSLVKNNEKDWEVNDEFGFGLYPFAYTSKGQPATNDESLMKMKELVDKEYVKRGLSGSKV
tara:strand:+ start:79026 stop:79559 length:534 start_codon:yes stop_codon:yes gene_type:complete